MNQSRCVLYDEPGASVRNLRDLQQVDGAMRLCINETGRTYVRPPKLHSSSGRLILQGGPERAAMLVDALKMLAGFRLADSPLATAPEIAENRK